MNNMITTLEIIRFVAAIALCVALFALAVYGLYRNIKETAEDTVREELDYGRLRGIGQWRNSGKGRFEWEEEEC